MKGSRFFITCWVALAVLSCIPLLIPGLHIRPSDGILLSCSENVVIWVVASSLVSISSSIPVVIDLILDFKLPWIDLYPRFALIAGIFFPNAIILVVYLLVESRSILFVSINCAYYMRLNLLRGSMMSYIFRYDYPVYFRKLALLWSAQGALSAIYHQLNSFDGVLPFESEIITNIIGVGTLAANIYCSYAFVGHLKELYSITSSDAEDKIFGIYFALSWLLNGFIKVIGIMFTDGATILPLNICIDFVIATLGCYVSAKKYRTKYERLTISLESKRSFVRYVAHEIRTPLNSSMLGLQLAIEEASRRGQGFGRDLETLTDSLRATEEAIDVLNDLLLIDKVESGSLALERDTLEALPLLRSIFSCFTLQAQAKRFEYVLDAGVEVEGVLINVDRKKLTQVCRNFLSNAMKFTPAGGAVRMKVLVLPGALGSAGVLRIEVTDSGVGIKPENLRRLFHEVVQFDAAKLQDGGGSGLGLTISRAIMESHGGKVGVSSVYEQGSCFFAEIGIASRSKIEQAPVTIRGGQRSLSRAVDPQRRDMALGCVLVVDDSKLNVMVVRKLLSSYASEIVDAPDGLCAAEIVKASLRRGGTPIDMIITDYHMPNMDGMELAACVRTMGYRGFMVLLSGDSCGSEDLKSEFVRHGGNEVAGKPFTEDNMYRVLTASDSWESA